MARFPRDKGDSGIYHIMIRGINKMNLFYNKYEKLKFLEIVSRMKSQQEFSLYAYCIMNNHAHLLLKEEIDSLSRSMHRISVSYSYYYNKKEERVGPLFQGRFRSEKIENDEYLLECIRYIHNNPVKANIVSRPEEYRFSSYNIYINRNDDELELIDTQFPLSIFSDDKNNALKKFVDFTNEKSKINFIDFDDNDREVSPEEIIDSIIAKYNHSIESLRIHKDRSNRDLILSDLKENTSLSVLEISKITGISKDIIYKA